MPHTPDMQGHVWLNIYPHHDYGEVILHVYHLSTSRVVRGANVVLQKLGSGLFHVGIEVHGTEWSYGWKRAGSGVYSCRPATSRRHYYWAPMRMGRTQLSHGRVQAMLDAMSDEWVGRDYSIFGHNCCTFCDALCQRLGVGELPDRVKHMAAMGGRLGGLGRWRRQRRRRPFARRTPVIPVEPLVRSQGPAIDHRDAREAEPELDGDPAEDVGCRHEHPSELPVQKAHSDEARMLAIFSANAHSEQSRSKCAWRRSDRVPSANLRRIVDHESDGQELEAARSQMEAARSQSEDPNMLASLPVDGSSGQ
mmetsp:Transcript_136240/g.264999  ORF Transcript_136240/g.264999 Transcript_136240/m.264999 type:complete len:308 (+) Transcript_136240:50-973(+)